MLLALPRPKVFRRLWAQLAALGVGRIVLTNAERVERHYFDTHVVDASAYRPLLIEGLQQAGDTGYPRVDSSAIPGARQDELDALSVTGRAWSPPRQPPLAVAERAKGRRRRVLLAIGPEGGWNDFELRMLTRHGFELVGMGPRILRTDTACIALLALVHEALRLPAR